MDFRTEFAAKVSKKRIELSDSIITVGSCFSDDIGARLAGNKFIISANPLGTIYNPISIHKVLLYAIQKSKPSQNGFIARDGIEYFPSYEIMMDDLRDYRFNKADLIHPSSAV